MKPLYSPIRSGQRFINEGGTPFLHQTVKTTSLVRLAWEKHVTSEIKLGGFCEKHVSRQTSSTEYKWRPLFHLEISIFLISIANITLSNHGAMVMFSQNEEAITQYENINPLLCLRKSRRNGCVCVCVCVCERRSGTVMIDITLLYIYSELFFCACSTIAWSRTGLST